jgi:osmotically-inducible protein OsmY
MNCKHLMMVAVSGVLMAAGSVAGAEDLATRTTDQMITQQVKQKLASDDPRVAPRIFVTTRDGVVTLLGRELTPWEIQTALNDATNTQGVVRVENRLENG